MRFFYFYKDHLGLEICIGFLMMCFCVGFGVAEGRLSLSHARKEMITLGIPLERIENLLKGEISTRNLSNNGAVCQLVVDSTHFLPITLQTAKTVKPQLILETLSPIFDTERKPRLELFNSVLHLRSLSGLQYYHPVEKSLKEFIIGAYTLDTPFTIFGRPDYLLPKIPQTYTVYLHQTDTIFGTTTFCVDYYSYGDELMIIFRNLDILRVKGTPFELAQSKSFCLILQYIPFKEVKEGLFYSAIFVNGEFEFLSREDLTEKFFSVMRAFRDWVIRDFTKRIL